MAATRSPLSRVELFPVLHHLRQALAQRHSLTTVAKAAAVDLHHDECSAGYVASSFPQLHQLQQQQPTSCRDPPLQHKQFIQQRAQALPFHTAGSMANNMANSISICSSMQRNLLTSIIHRRNSSAFAQTAKQQTWHQQSCRCFASMPCRLTEDVDSRDQLQPAADPMTAAGNSPRLNRRLSSIGNSSSSSSDGAAEEDSSAAATAAAAAAAAADEPGRRRRTTESKSAMRRTTESRAAIEDVAVMTKSQLLRRKKAWLAEQCWERQLAHDGLKDDLIQRLLDWQLTDQGKQAAAEAVAEAQAAIAVVDAAAATSSTAGQMTAAAVTAGAGLSQASSSQEMQDKPGMAAVLPAPGVTAPLADSVSGSADSGDVSNDNSINSGTPNRRRRRSTSSAGADSGDSAESTRPGVVTINSATAMLQQPPRNAAAAAAETVAVLLQQLQQQPENSSLVAVTRNALEASARGSLQSVRSNYPASPLTGYTGIAASAAAMEEAVQGLAAELTDNSSPQSLAALAKACYSREAQNEVLAAALAEAVASVSAQLGPQEVYGVLRLLVEHFAADGQDPGAIRTQTGAKAMTKGFNALAEGLIKCSVALQPRQLAEAVHLLQLHKYDDAYGLWMIAKEATERLREFAPADVVVLLDAIAAMCVADDALCQQVADVVGSSRSSYSEQQMQAVDTALQRMGFDRSL